MLDQHFNTDPEQLVSVPDAADLFKVKLSTMQRWVRVGHVPSVAYPGGRRMISKDWISWFLSAGSTVDAESIDR